MNGIYVAHNFAARDWLRNVVKPELEAVGYRITSRWISDDSHLEENTQQQSAAHDLEDVEAAGCLFLFTDNYGGRPGRGKYVEFGYALRAGKQVFLIGADQSGCVFYNLPNVRHCPNLSDAIALLPKRTHGSALAESAVHP